jgi:hypothetical protein
MGSEELEDAEARAGAALGQLQSAAVPSALHEFFLQEQKRGEKSSLMCRRKDRVLQVHRRTTPSLMPGTLMARFEVGISPTCIIRSAVRSVPNSCFRNMHRRNRAQWIFDQIVEEKSWYYKRRIYVRERCGGQRNECAT